MNNEDPQVQICVEVNSNPNKMVQIADIVIQVIDHYEPLGVGVTEIRKAVEFGLSTIDAIKSEL